MYPWQRKFSVLYLKQTVHREVWDELERRVEHQAYIIQYSVVVTNKETSYEEGVSSLQM
jgi:hypothetical protein